MYFSAGRTALATTREGFLGKHGLRINSSYLLPPQFTVFISLSLLSLPLPLVYIFDLCTMFSVSLLYALAVILSFVPNLYVHGFPKGLRHHLPPSHSIASRNTLRQIDAFLDAHNIIRAEHNATALQWSTSLAAKAELWVDQCQFRHTNGVLSSGVYGENIAAGTGAFPIAAAVASFVADKGSFV